MNPLPDHLARGLGPPDEAALYMVLLRVQLGHEEPIRVYSPTLGAMEYVWTRHTGLLHIWEWESWGRKEWEES